MFVELLRGSVSDILNHLVFGLGCGSTEEPCKAAWLGVISVFNLFGLDSYNFGSEEIRGVSLELPISAIRGKVGGCALMFALGG